MFTLHAYQLVRTNDENRDPSERVRRNISPTEGWAINPSSLGFAPPDATVLTQVALSPDTVVRCELHDKDGRILAQWSSRTDPHGRIIAATLARSHAGRVRVRVTFVRVCAETDDYNVSIRVSLPDMAHRLVLAARGEVKAISREMSEARRTGKLMQRTARWTVETAIEEMRATASVQLYEG